MSPHINYLVGLEHSTKKWEMCTQLQFLSCLREHSETLLFCRCSTSQASSRLFDKQVHCISKSMHSNLQCPCFHFSFGLTASRVAGSQRMPFRQDEVLQETWARMPLPKEEQNVTSVTPQTIYYLVSFLCCFTSGYLNICGVLLGLFCFKIGSMSYVNSWLLNYDTINQFNEIMQAIKLFK